MKDTKIQWHPGFVAAMNLKFMENKDELNINTFYKVQGYACLYKAAGTAAAEINEDDITATIVREGKPRGLFGRFNEKGFEITNICKGVYCIHTSSLFRHRSL